MYTPSSFSPPPLEGLCCLPPPEGQQVLFSSCSGPRSRLRSSVMIFFFFFLLLLFFVSFSFSSIPTLDLPTYLPSFFYFSLSLLLLLFLFFSKCSRGHSHHSPNVRGTLALVVYVWSYQEPLQVCTGNKKKREREEGLVAFSFKFKNSFVPFFFILFFFFLFPPTFSR